MHVATKSGGRVAVLLCVILGSAACAADSAPVTQEAAHILKTAGVRGGLVVHVGCGDGRLTAALRATDAYLVHGLDRARGEVQRARDYIRSKGLTGAVSVAHWNRGELPYVDNLVNLLVCERSARPSMDEVMRVLAPRGVACLKRGGRWEKVVKPWPQEIDEWTHFLHGPDNNAVADDTVVDQPYHLQWVASPRWARHHNYLASTSAVVSAGGRVFAIIDEGPTHSVSLPPEWRLVARDAFSGVTLWKRPIERWEGHLRRFRSGPPEVKRKLVADGDRVYVALGYGEPVTVLDAATGETLRTCEGTEGAVEIVHCGGVLYLVMGDREAARQADAARRRGATAPPRNKRIRAVEAETGRTLWVKDDGLTRELLPMTLCVGGGRVFFHSTTGMVCLDAETGEELWHAPRPSATRRMGWSTPTVVLHDGVVLCADRSGPAGADPEELRSASVEWVPSSRPNHGKGRLIAFSAEDGSRLWSCPAAVGYNAPPDVFVADGLVWVGTVPGRNTEDFTEGRDPYSGEVKRRLETGPAFESAHHHRCYRDKATSRQILLGRTGVEFIDLKGDRPLRHCWIRGGCQYGVMPANGLLYLPPHSCACYIQSKLSGFYSLAPRGGSAAPAHGGSHPLELNPACGEGRTSSAADPADWPTYRHDPLRSGRAGCAVPAGLTAAWQAKPGGRLTAPVIADGVLCVASVDRHTVHALDAGSGEKLWSFTAGGRIDSPPTLYRGLALFGCADGWVYCLRLADGRLVWRRRAAPAGRRAVSFGQVESVWPVTGSVLVHEGQVYCTAGRTSYLDGGMYLLRLDPETGKLLGRKRFYSRDPQTGAQPEGEIVDVELPGALPDVLACDGENIFLRDMRLSETGEELPHTVRHVYSSVGFLDGSWWHRTYWILGTHTFGRAAGWWVVANYVPSGRILAWDESSIYGYGRSRVRYSGRGLKDQLHRFFGADREVVTLEREFSHRNKALEQRFTPTETQYHWSREVPLVMRAMVLAGDTLFAAGPPMGLEGDAEEPLFDRGPGAMIAASTRDGRTLARYELQAQPVFDGMAAARGRIYLCTVDGRVVCMRGE